MPLSFKAFAKRRPRLGFLVRNNAFWLSELLAGAIVGLVLLFLMSFTVIFFCKVMQGRSADRRIELLRAEKIENEHAIADMRRELQVLTLLRRLAAGKIADSTLCTTAALVHRNSVRFGYDPLLLLAVIRVESIFNPVARGRYMSGTESGAFGLMQLQFETADEVAQQLHLPKLGRMDLFKPDVNLVLGVAYLTRLITEFKSFKLGLIAYNEGPETVLQTLSSGAPLALDYYKAVLAHYYELKNLSKKINADAVVPLMPAP